MSLDLTEFAGTLAVGTFALAVIVILACRRTSGEIVTWLKENKEVLPTLVWLFLILSFTLGILAERVSDFWEEKIGFILPSDEGIRECVFTKKGKLAGEYAQVEEKTRVSESETRVIRPWACMNANDVYHAARPAVIEVESYGSELARIQTTVRFTRSLAFLSVVLFIPSLFLCFRGSAGPLRCERKAMTLGLLIIGALSYASNYLSEEEYDKRVYSYHLHLLKKPKAGEGRG